MPSSSDSREKSGPSFPVLLAAGVVVAFVVGANRYVGWGTAPFQLVAFWLCASLSWHPARTRRLATLQRRIVPGGVLGAALAGFVLACLMSVGVWIGNLGWDAWVAHIDENKWRLGVYSPLVVGDGLAGLSLTLFVLLSSCELVAWWRGSLGEHAEELAAVEGEDPSHLTDLVGEVALAGWFAVLALSSDYERGVAAVVEGATSADSWLPPAMASPVLVALGLPWLLLWRSSPACERMVSAHLLLASLVALAHGRWVWSAVSHTHDAMIEWLVNQYWVRWYGFWVVAVCGVILAVVLFAGLSTPIVWRGGLSGVMNRLALASVRRRFAQEPRGRFFARLRHVGHTVTRLRPMFDVIVFVPRILLGPAPAWLAPDGYDRYSRLEQFLREELDAAAERVDDCDRHWRAARLFDADSTVELLRRLQDSATRHAMLLLALADHWRCPYCARESSRARSLSDDWELWRFRADSLLVVCDTAGLEIPADAREELRSAVRRAYGHAQRKASHAGDIEDVCIAWRLDALTALEVGSERPCAESEVWIRRWRDRMFEACAVAAAADGGRSATDRGAVRVFRVNPDGAAANVSDSAEESQVSPAARGSVDWLRFSIHSLLAWYRRHDAWEAVIETCVWLRDETDYELSADDELDLGEAWWNYAGGVDQSTWACQQAIGCFFAAESVHHLRWGDVSRMEGSRR